jgi:hypothetical protein
MNTKCTTDWFVFIQQEHNLDTFINQSITILGNLHSF